MASILLRPNMKCFIQTRHATPLLSTTRRMSSYKTQAPLLLTPTDLNRLTSSSNGASKVSLLDASWFMPNSPRKAEEEFKAKRIPGAQFLDLDQVASPNELGLKHMMPTSKIFAQACERFGIEPSSHVVIYDSHGVFSAPRALFMFRAFGHHNSSVLDGGLPRWQDEGFAIDSKEPSAASKSSYEPPSMDTNVIKDYEQMVSNSCLKPSSEPHAAIVLDARSKGRFLGTDPEPRAGLSSGHMPNSFSLPFNMFLQTRKSSDGSFEYTTFRQPKELQAKLVDAVGAEQAGLIVSGRRPVITSCGSGMTAGVLWLGLRLLGVDDVGVYDESWTGYASRRESQIEKAVEESQ